MATRMKNVEELLYYDKCRELECMRWRLLAECCRLQRNFDSLMEDLKGSTLAPVEEWFMESRFEYPTERK